MQKARLLSGLLVLGVVLLVADLLLTFATALLAGDHYTHNETFIYPLLLHYYDGNYPALEYYVATVAIVAILFSAYHHPNKKLMERVLWLLALPLLCMCLYAGWMSFGSLRRPFSHLDSVQFRGHTYQLAAAACYEMDSTCSPTAYLIFKCDNLGLICDLWYVPPTTDGGDIRNGTLMVNPADNILEAQIGSEKFRIAKPLNSDYSP